jgi:hypothetical protein
MLSHEQHVSACTKVAVQLLLLLQQKQEQPPDFTLTLRDLGGI